jgi:ubiquinone/menaquinone biosynthesis C-methylase UbiE
MTPKQPADPEIAAFLHEWHRCMLEKDVEAAARLRADGYRATLPDDSVLDPDAELALLRDAGQELRAVGTGDVEIRRGRRRATVVASLTLESVREGVPHTGSFLSTLELRRSGPEWRAIRSRLQKLDVPWNPPPRPALVRAASWAKRLVGGRMGATPAFQEVAYYPYRPGKSFAIPPAPDRSGPLPVPPRELWLGYNYPEHGELHASTMLELVHASGLAFAPGDRILDLGCGAGRMIRHLEHLAESCEIWGTDISAEHIYWCKANLSPPFHFATTTRVPHLPFEDRSFRLVYCGSVFTHIDDLADAWLLELHRILAPDGRLYVTIHDEDSVRWFDDDPHATPLSRKLLEDETYQRAKHSAGLISIDRDDQSQVFYQREHFSKMARSMFEIESVTPGAYFYQTAFVLRRKRGAGSK